MTDKKDKKPVGHPVEYDVNDITDKLNEYIDTHDEPFVIEFILQYGISKSQFYKLAEDNKRLSDANARAILKRELYINKLAQTRQYDPNFAQFILKQPAFGYKDKVDISADVTNKTETPEALKNLSAAELQTLLEQAKKAGK